ncbi:hypothetical protein L0F63_007378 [Massospora cicadina]|nr:hypothetical protein L0F63_007378 [Massospora cicadina]
MDLPDNENVAPNLNFQSVDGAFEPSPRQSIATGPEGLTSKPEVTISQPQTAHFSHPPNQTANRKASPPRFAGELPKGSDGSPVKPSFDFSTPNRILETPETASGSNLSDTASPSNPTVATHDGHGRRSTDLSVPPAAKFNPEPHTNLNLGTVPTTSASEVSNPRDTLPPRKFSLKGIAEEPSREGQISEPEVSSNSNTSNQGLWIFQGRRKNVEFHSLFPALPPNETLIADYGCALQKGTLVQGRMYLTQTSVAFYSSFFGWVNRVSIPLAEIVCIEKRHVAYVIPSAIQVATLHHKYVFTSFRNRDSVLIQLNTLWREAKVSAEPPNGTIQPTNDGASVLDELSRWIFNRSPRRGPHPSAPPPEEKSTGAPKNACGDELHDEVLEMRFKVPPGDVYDLLYGKDPHWLLSFLKGSLQGVVVEPWENRSRKITYVKPSGPRSTRWVVTQKVLQLDLPHQATLLDSVESVDVPSGNSVGAKAKVCILGGGGGGTRLVLTGGPDWFKFSWVNAILEASDGVSKYACGLERALLTHLAKPSTAERRGPSVEGANFRHLKSAAGAVWGWASRWPLPSTAWLAYRMGLIVLAASLLVSNVTNWRRVSGLERRLKLLQDAPDAPPLEEALDDIARFANHLRRSVSALDQHIELVIAKYIPYRGPEGSPNPGIVEGGAQPQ